MPFDFGGIEANPNWRADLAWPISPLALGELYRQILSQYLALIRRLSGQDQRIAILAMAPVAGVAMSAFEIACYADAEAQTAIRVDGTEPEFKYFRGEASALPAPRMRRLVEKVAAPRLPFRRNAQVTSWWTPWLRVVPTMIAPDTTAVGENSFLISSARRSPKRIAFRHGGIFLKAARRKTAAPADSVGALAETIVQTMMGVLKVGKDGLQRADALLKANCAPLLQLVSSDLNGLSQTAQLPNEMWSGTAADYVTRGIGLEVIRRGGSVTRFDHGGTIGMMDYPEVTAALELLATTTHYMPSETLAANVRSSGALALLPADQPISIVGQAAIEPTPEIPGSERAVPRRRKVVYCPTLLIGFRRHAFSTLPDPLSLDWSLRIAEALGKMPVDLLCKPHPEGVLQGREHPVSKIAATSYRPFEEEMAGADVFVFDRCHSTAFWIALGTDRPVVYLEATPPALHPAVQDTIERRCRILRASFDDRNRPQIDAGAFRDAVLGGESRIDPAEAREILLGQSA